MAIPKRRLSKSVRIYLRREKARLRKESGGETGAQEEIKKLVGKIFATYTKGVAE